MKIINGKQRVLGMKHAGDVVVFSQTNGSALDNEDVPLIGSWSEKDIAGNITSGGVITISQLMYAGTQKTNWGENSSILGGDTYKRTNRGLRKATHRTKRRTENVDF